MADVFDSIERSRVMSLIRSKDTKPELRIRQGLHRRGYRFRVNVRTLPGKPDIVLSKYRTVVQIRGCFWHGHSCHDGHLPKTKREYWIEKLSSNTRRDARNDRRLRNLGWSVIVIWECQCMSNSKCQKSLDRIARFLSAREVIRERSS